MTASTTAARRAPLGHATDRLPLAAAGLDARFAERVAARRAPASAWGLGLGGRLVASGGHADASVGPRPGPDTAFRIASCTKSFTAAAALQLRDAGRLDLDARLDELLEVRCTAADGGAGAAPTLRQLLAMDGGLPTDDPWADRQESLPAADLDALAAAGLRQVRPPGTGYEYSNLGFVLVGRVLERVAGTPFTALVAEQLLEPLALGGVGFDVRVTEREGVDGLAVGHVLRDGAWEPQPFTAPGAFSPLGGLFATVRALTAWTGWLAAAWAPGADAAGTADGPGGAVLSAASRRELQAPLTRIDERTGYALGLVVEEHPRHGTVVSHSGGYPGYGAQVRWHPATGTTLVALENGRYSRPGEAVSAGLVDVLDAIAVPAAPPALWPETVAAREAVERLLRRWDDAAADRLLAGNVDLDEPLARRRTRLRELAERVGLADDAPVVPLAAAAPASDSPAHLVWTVPGALGLLRAEVLLTPTDPPRVQVLEVGVV